jgi:IclR family KDG regulon transcriptional repressor
MIFPMVDFFHAGREFRRGSLDLLECLATGSSRTESELSASASMMKAAAYRILRTLEKRGYVTTFERVRRYFIGQAFRSYAEAARDSNRLLRTAPPLMRLSGPRRARPSILPSSTEAGSIYLEIIESERGLRTTGSVGLFDALHSTALGKAIMSHLPRGETARLLAKAEMLPRSGRTIIDLEQLPAAFDEVARANYAIDDEENEIGMRCVAAATVNADGWPIAAVSVSGPTLRMADDVLAVVRAKLLCRL